MKKHFFHVSSSPVASGLGLLLLRLMFGFGMLYGHGWKKLMDFNNNWSSFHDPLGIGSPASFSGALFAEVLCAALVGLGLFTRIALVPLMFTMGVAVFIFHGGDSFSTIERGLLYLTAYATLFLTGPGKYSMDQLFR